MGQIKVTLEMFHDYVTYSDKYQQLGVAQIPTIQVDSRADDARNVKGLIEMVPNEASFMDTWWSVYPDWDTDEHNFLSVSKWS